MIGIYNIVNKTNGKKYIGSSRNIQSRWSKHKSLLRHNKHENIKLQNAWNKYGEEMFEFIIVEECEFDVLLDVEQKYLDEMGAQDLITKKSNCFDKNCYNIAPDTKFHQLTDEHRAKIKETLRVMRDNGELKKTNTKYCYQYNRFTGELIRKWDVINDANRHYKTPNKTTSVIQRNLWGKTTSAFDSLWSYEPIEFKWCRAPQKRSTIVAIDTIKKTYGFYDSISIFLEAIGLNPNSRVTITKCIENNTLFKGYSVFKVNSPIIYDCESFELLGTREDLITKTGEEILNGNV